MNLASGITIAAIDDVNAYIVASTCAGVSFAKSTPGGSIKKAKIKVPIAVDEQMTHATSGMPSETFHLNTKHMSKKLATQIRTIAQLMMTLGSVSLKNR